MIVVLCARVRVFVCVRVCIYVYICTQPSHCKSNQNREISIIPEVSYILIRIQYEHKIIINHIIILFKVYNFIIMYIVHVLDQ